MIIDSNTYLNITTNTTTQVYTGPCTLASITINTPAAGAISIIDNTTGTTANIGTIASSSAAGTYTYNVQCSKGLRIVTAASTDITVAYRV